MPQGDLHMVYELTTDDPPLKPVPGSECYSYITAHTKACKLNESAPDTGKWHIVGKVEDKHINKKKRQDAKR